jgi:hypothetical protein
MGTRWEARANAGSLPQKSREEATPMSVFVIIHTKVDDTETHHRDRIK